MKNEYVREFIRNVNELNLHSGVLYDIKNNLGCIDCMDLEELKLNIQDKLNEYNDVIKQRLDNSTIARKVRRALIQHSGKVLRIQLRILLDNRNKKFR